MLIKEERKEVLSDEQKVGFQKFATNILKKEYPFISRLNFDLFPIVDSLDFIFKLEVLLDYEYMKKQERVLRHITLDELKFRMKRDERVTAWETRLFFHPFSSSDLAKKIQEMVAIMTGENKINDLYNVWDIQYSIDPRTNMS